MNCQTNSNNFAFNVINHRYRRADAFALDSAEIHLAAGKKEIVFEKELEKLEHPKHHKKHKRVSGEGAYGGPAAVMGAGKYNLLRAFRHTMESVGREMKPIAMTALHAGLGAGKKALAARLMGGGSYTLAGDVHLLDMDNPIVNNLVNNRYPSVSMHSIKQESEGVRYRGIEYIGDIFNNTANALVGITFPINPGLPSFAPRMSQLGVNYVGYTVLKLLFFFKSDVVSTGGSLGEVGGVHLQNAGAPAPNSRIQILDYYGGQMARIDQDMVIGAECDRSKSSLPGRLFIRTTGVPSGQDVKTYDYGQFCFYTYNIPSAVVPNGGIVGRLYMYAEVELDTPVLSAALGNGIGQDCFTQTTGLSAATLLATTATPVATNNIGGFIGANNRYYFPDDFTGTVKVTVENVGTTFANAYNIPAVAGNVALLNVEINSANYSCVTSGTSMTQSFFLSVTSAITHSGNYFTLNQSSFTAATVTSSKMWVMQVNPAQS